MNWQGLTHASYLHLASFSLGTLNWNYGLHPVMHTGLPSLYSAAFHCIHASECRWPLVSFEVQSVFSVHSPEECYTGIASCDYLCASLFMHSEYSSLPYSASWTLGMCWSLV